MQALAICDTQVVGRHVLPDVLLSALERQGMQIDLKWIMHVCADNAPRCIVLSQLLLKGSDLHFSKVAQYPRHPIVSARRLP